MTRNIIIALALLLALATPASAATTLTASPSPVEFGSIAVGSCNLDTFDGCLVQTITITNSGKRVSLGGYAVQSPLSDVSLDPGPHIKGDCALLHGRYWDLGRNRSCTIRVAMAPDYGSVERSLVILDPQDNTLLTVLLRATGVR